MEDEPDMMPVVTALTAEIIEQLGASLIGLYLYGSLVLGDFDERRSDVDLLAVTQDELNPHVARAIAEMHGMMAECFPEWRDRVEVGYFPLAVVTDVNAPLGPVYRISPGEPFHRTLALPHWLTDLYSVQEHGHAMYGPASTSVLPRISPARFRGTIQELVAEWRNWVVGVREQRHQAYVRLTMFRSLYAFQTAHQISKVAAARWFATEFPEWAAEAAEAVAWRHEDSEVRDVVGAQRTRALVTFVYDGCR